jgi:PAS domain S-box-containing protein
VQRIDPDDSLGALIAGDHLGLAIEAARLGTWTWNMAAGTTVWDPRMEEMHGLAPGGFGGTFEDWLASMYPEDRAESLALVDKALSHPGPYTLLHRTAWPDGTVHHIECRGMVLVDDDGRPTGTTGVAFDVTDREQHKEALADALHHQHRVVERLQQALLPSQLPRVAGIELATRLVTAQRNVEIGGDWYAVLPLEGDRLGLAIGDVAGHGLDAVADMAAARFSLRALALTEDAPEVVLERLNEVVRVFESGTMITALHGVLDPKSRVWTYASAGHCPAIVRHADGTTVVLDERCDPPLGYATSFHRRRVELPPRATLILYTDGLMERRNETIDVGIARLARACANGPSDPEALCDHLVATMFDGTTIDDDVMIVAASLQ